MDLLFAIYRFFIDPILTLLIILLIVGAVLSWLVAFDVVNPRNQLVSAIGRFYHAVTEPLLRPIRKVIPPLGGVDVSPIFLFLAIYFVKDWLIPQALFALAGSPTSAF